MFLQFAHAGSSEIELTSAENIDIVYTGCRYWAIRRRIL